MSKTKQKITLEAAALAGWVAHLEEVLGQTKAKYWAKLEELHSLEDDRDYPIDGETLAEMAKRYKTDDKFTLGKGAVTCDDT